MISEKKSMKFFSFLLLFLFNVFFRLYSKQISMVNEKKVQLEFVDNFIAVEDLFESVRRKFYFERSRIPKTNEIDEKQEEHS